MHVRMSGCSIVSGSFWVVSEHDYKFLFWVCQCTIQNGVSFLWPQEQAFDWNFIPCLTCDRNLFNPAAIASNVCFRHCLNIFLISNPLPRPVVQPSIHDKAPRKQEIKFSKPRFRGNSKLPSDTQRQGPSFKFGQSPHFETELNKIRNNFDLRRGGEPTFLERISNFFQPISRIMSHPWKWSDLSGHYVYKAIVCLVLWKSLSSHCLLI